MDDRPCRCVLLKETRVKIWKTLAASTLALATATPAFALEFGYSVATDNFLYEINLTTGVATRVGAAQVALAQVEGMAFLSPGVLIGIGGNNPQASRQIWNLSTPPGSFLSQTTLASDNDAGLASHNGQVFVTLGFNFTSMIFEVDANNGSNLQSEIITANQGDLYADSLAINSSGQAFIVDPIDTDALYQLDLGGVSFGAATLIGTDLGLGDIAAQSGLDFTSTGVLHMLLSDGGLYTLSTTTGLATAIATVTFNNNPLTFLGGFAIGDVNAVAAVVVPEPATMTLAMLGLTALTLLRRERR